MKQQTRRLMIIIGSTLLTAGGITLAACSTDNGSTPLPSTGNDSGAGKDTGAKDGSSSGSSGGEDGDTPKDSGTGGVDCGDAPTLHKTTAGFFCAFYKDGGAADAGGNSNCANIETCCNPGGSSGNFGPSFCASTATKNNTADTACNTQSTPKTGVAWVENGGTTWECASKENCGPNQTCCIVTSDAEIADGGHVNIGKASGKTAPPAACNAQQAYKYGGTVCATSCTGLDQIELCSETAPCAGGKTCEPFVVQPGFRDFGHCK